MPDALLGAGKPVRRDRVCSPGVYGPVSTLAGFLVKGSMVISWAFRAVMSSSQLLYCCIVKVATIGKWMIAAVF